ncbi:prolyl 3-hydroxylase /prolyl 3,4-dihydroxylase [Nematocida sp. LUAm3]|nr:prolyl 3-hydroxylase /prolyl 3,4-dihydroxylase [Nematocida sp. LUAm3]KAI5175387.1 prolyl 3-hydroxylase /prolyl 3,4-dihydroxylase [Nematocida sp. LUAm2]KAI5177656.1 prolyl 3-hydroxylase /prolyl 3,4-dihydroxylase [Nematocida sp. LUAm1]
MQQETVQKKAEIEYSHPFYHKMVDGFLSADELAKAKEVYASTSLFVKHSDLFRFYQSKELRNKEEYAWFLDRVKNEILKTAEKLGKDIISPEMDLFASFYSESHFLLPHDDCLDERIFAFSFYLGTMEDIENEESNGALALYEGDGLTFSKRVPVVENRLVIFEVSEKSFHEVEKCFGRREALTGWMRSKNYAPQSTILPYRENRYFFLDPMRSFSLQEEHIQTDCIEWNMDKNYSELITTLEGMKWKPRLNLLSCRVFEPEEAADEEYTLAPFSIIGVLGQLVDSIVLKVEKNGYFLLNDPFNCESDVLVVISLFNDQIVVVGEKDSEEADTEEKEDVPLHIINRSPEETTVTCMVYPKANRKIFIPPSKGTGYVIAYRINLAACEDNSSVENGEE